MSEDLWPGPSVGSYLPERTGKEVEVCMACDCGQDSGERKGCRERRGLLDCWMESLQEEAKEQFPGGFHVTLTSAWKLE